MKVKVLNKEYKMEKQECGYWYCEIPTTISSPVVITTNDKKNFFISMLSGGNTGAIGIYSIHCGVEKLQSMVDLFFTEIKKAEGIEVKNE